MQSYDINLINHKTADILIGSFIFRDIPTPLGIRYIVAKWGHDKDGNPTNVRFEKAIS